MIYLPYDPNVFPNSNVSLIPGALRKDRFEARHCMTSLTAP